jgi:hypothetical protein
MARDKLRHGQHQRIGAIAAQSPGFMIIGQRQHATALLRRGMDKALAAADMRCDALGHLMREAGVALGPDQFALADAARGPATAAGEITDARPGRNMFQLRAVIVTAAVADIGPQGPLVKCCWSSHAAKWVLSSAV